MRTDSPKTHPTPPHVSDGERTDASSSKIPPNHQVIAECTQTSQGAPHASIEPNDSTSGHLCEVCREGYSTKKKVLRHFNREHKDLSPCLVSSCDFRWKRPYLYSDHLKLCRPGIDRKKVLGKCAGSRRKSKILGRDLTPPVSPPVVAPDGQSQAEPSQFPMTTPLPAPTNATYGPSPALSFAVHDSQPEGAEPAVAALNHDAGVSELAHPTDSSFAFWLEMADQVREEVYSVADGQEWSPSAHPEGFTAADAYPTQVPPSANPCWL